MNNNRKVAKSRETRVFCSAALDSSALGKVDDRRIRDKVTVSNGEGLNVARCRTNSTLNGFCDSVSTCSNNRKTAACHYITPDFSANKRHSRNSAKNNIGNSFEEADDVSASGVCDKNSINDEVILNHDVLVRVDFDWYDGVKSPSATGTDRSGDKNNSNSRGGRRNDGESWFFDFLDDVPKLNEQTGKVENDDIGNEQRQPEINGENQATIENEYYPLDDANRVDIEQPAPNTPDDLDIETNKPATVDIAAGGFHLGNATTSGDLRMGAVESRDTKIKNIIGKDDGTNIRLSSYRHRNDGLCLVDKTAQDDEIADTFGKVTQTDTGMPLDESRLHSRLDENIKVNYRDKSVTNAHVAIEIRPLKQAKGNYYNSVSNGRRLGQCSGIASDATMRDEPDEESTSNGQLENVALRDILHDENITRESTEAETLGPQNDAANSDMTSVVVHETGSRNPLSGSDYRPADIITDCDFSSNQISVSTANDECKFNQSNIDYGNHSKTDKGDRVHLHMSDEPASKPNGPGTTDSLGQTRNSNAVIFRRSGFKLDYKPSYVRQYESVDSRNGHDSTDSNSLCSSTSDSVDRIIHNRTEITDSRDKSDSYHKYIREFGDDNGVVSDVVISVGDNSENADFCNTPYDKNVYVLAKSKNDEFSELTQYDNIRLVEEQQQRINADTNEVSGICHVITRTVLDANCTVPSNKSEINDSVQLTRSNSPTVDGLSIPNASDESDKESEEESVAESFVSVISTASTERVVIDEKPGPLPGFGDKVEDCVRATSETRNRTLFDQQRIVYRRWSDSGIPNNPDMPSPDSRDGAISDGSKVLPQLVRKKVKVKRRAPAPPTKIDDFFKIKIDAKLDAANTAYENLPPYSQTLAPSDYDQQLCAENANNARYPDVVGLCQSDVAAAFPTSYENVPVTSQNTNNALYDDVHTIASSPQTPLNNSIYEDVVIRTQPRFAVTNSDVITTEIDTASKSGVKNKRKFKNPFLMLKKVFSAKNTESASNIRINGPPQGEAQTALVKNQEDLQNNNQNSNGTEDPPSVIAAAERPPSPKPEELQEKFNVPGLTRELKPDVSEMSEQRGNENRCSRRSVDNMPVLDIKQTVRREMKRTVRNRRNERDLYYDEEDEEVEREVRHRSSTNRHRHGRDANSDDEMVSQEHNRRHQRRRHRHRHRDDREGRRHRDTMHDHFKDSIRQQEYMYSTPKRSAQRHGQQNRQRIEATRQHQQQVRQQERRKHIRNSSYANHQPQSQQRLSLPPQNNNTPQNYQLEQYFKSLQNYQRSTNKNLSPLTQDNLYEFNVNEHALAESLWEKVYQQLLAIDLDADGNYQDDPDMDEELPSKNDEGYSSVRSSQISRLEPPDILMPALRAHDSTHTRPNVHIDISRGDDIVLRFSDWNPRTAVAIQTPANISYFSYISVRCEKYGPSKSGPIVATKTNEIHQNRSSFAQTTSPPHTTLRLGTATEARWRPSTSYC